MSFMLAVRSMLDVVDALVPVRERACAEEVAVASGLVWVSSGRGKGTGVDIFAFALWDGSGEDIVDGRKTGGAAAFVDQMRSGASAYLVSYIPVLD